MDTMSNQTDLPLTVTLDLVSVHTVFMLYGCSLAQVKLYELHQVILFIQPGVTCVCQSSGGELSNSEQEPPHKHSKMVSVHRIERDKRVPYSSTTTQPRSLSNVFPRNMCPYTACCFHKKLPKLIRTQWRIQDFVDSGRQPETAWKWKKMDRGGARNPGVPPPNPDPPMEHVISISLFTPIPVKSSDIKRTFLH